MSEIHNVSFDLFDGCLESSWENDDDPDDVYNKFLEAAKINDEYIKINKKNLEEEISKSIHSNYQDVNYKLFNNMQILKNLFSLLIKGNDNILEKEEGDLKAEIIDNQLFTIDSIQELIDKFNEYGMNSLACLLEYIYIEKCHVNSWNTSTCLMLFRKILESQLIGMQRLNLIFSNQDNIGKGIDLYRSWRIEQKEIDMLKLTDSNGYLSVDTFLSTTEDLKTALDFFEKHNKSNKIIVWEIKNAKGIKIKNSNLKEHILVLGSRLSFKRLRYVDDGKKSIEIKTFEFDEINDFEVSFKEYKKLLYKLELLCENIVFKQFSHNEKLLKLKIRDIKSKYNETEQLGGSKYRKTRITKIIMGRKRCIYKKPNDRKEYVKYKGKLVTLKEFKESLKKVKVK